MHITKATITRTARNYLPLALWALCCTTVFSATPPGFVLGWGSNGQGEATGTPTPPPKMVFEGGDRFGFSRNGFREMPLPCSTGLVSIAGQVLSNAVAVAAGNSHGLALRSDTTVVGWGLNRYGEATGAPTPQPASGPVLIDGQVLSNVVAITAGFYDSFALKRDGTVVRWGGIPVQPPMNLRAGLNNFTAIAAGYTSGLGITKDGAVQRLNSDLPLPDCGLTNIIALALGGDIDEVNLAIRKDRTVVQWHGAFNPKPVPDGLANIQAVAVGRQNRLALKSDGTVFAWGDNQYGQITGAPTKAAPHTASGLVTIAGNVLTNVVAIAAGGKYMYSIDHSLALKRDGTVVAWGNFGHRLAASTPAGLTNVVAIAAGGGGGTDSGGGGFCLAITTNSAVLKKLTGANERTEVRGSVKP